MVEIAGNLPILYIHVFARISQVNLPHDLKMVSTNKNPGTKKDNVDCDWDICTPLGKINGIKPQVLSARFFLTLIVVASEVS